MLKIFFLLQRRRGIKIDAHLWSVPLHIPSNKSPKEDTTYCVAEALQDPNSLLLMDSKDESGVYCFHSEMPVILVCHALLFTACC